MIKWSMEQNSCGKKNDVDWAMINNCDDQGHSDWSATDRDEKNYNEKYIIGDGRWSSQSAQLFYPVCTLTIYSSCNRWTMT